MRVVRTVAGLVLLTVGLPVLLIGGALWTLMQHRDAGGAFSGSLEPVSTSGRAIVVPDVDTLLREDAPFVRAGDTALRLTVREGSGPVFLGLAPAAAVRDYLAGADYSRVDGVTVGRGDLPLRVTPVGAAGLTAPIEAPGTQSFWTRQGSGTIEWTANEIDGREMSLVVMRVDANPGLTVSLAASARSGWLPPTAWSLLALGALLLGSAIASLVWPARTRELVFVVDPSQVPEVSARLGAATDGGPAGPPPVWPALPAGEVAEPVPVLPGSDRPADGSWPDWPSDSAPGRPATLADALAGAGKSVPAPSGPAWPSAQPGPSGAWPPVPDGASAWSRAEAARLAGMPAVSAVAAQLSVESVPTSGAPSGSATALPIAWAVEPTPRPRGEVDGSTDSDARTPVQRSAGSEGEAGVPAAKVAHLRSVKSDEAEPPAAKRATRTAAKKRPVVFVDTATEPTGESPDRPIVPPRTRSARATKTATKRTPQPREATSATDPAEGATAESAALQGAAGGIEVSESTAVVSAASAAPTTDAGALGSGASKAGLDASGVPTMDAGASGSGASKAALDPSAVRTTDAGASGSGASKAPLDPSAVRTTDAVGARGGATKAAPDAPAASASPTMDVSGSADRATQLALDVRGASELRTPAASGSARNAAAAAADALVAAARRPVRKKAAAALDGPTANAPLTAESSGSVGKKVEPALDGLIANPAPTTTAKGSRRAAAAKPAKSAPVDAVAAEPTTSGTEVIESTGSDSDDLTAAHGPASAGAPVGTGAVVSTTGAEAGEATKTRRTTRAKKATDPDAVPTKATRAPRRKTTATAAAEMPAPTADKPATLADEPAPTAGEPATSADERGPSATTPGPSAAGPATSAEVADSPAETGTPFGGPAGSATPAKPRRRKTAAGLPAPEATDAGPAHTAVSALVAKRPTTRRPATKATTKRPAAAENRATPTDQAS